MNFITFKTAVAKQWQKMQQHNLFRTDVDKDKLWNTYLSSFPEGTDIMFRERTEHDCSCCKQFIRNVGNVVAIIDGKVESIWDVSIPSEPAYQTVATSLSTLIKASAISDVFLHYERTVGTDKNFEQLADNVKTWDHFFVNIDLRFVSKAVDIPTELGEIRSTRDVFLRGLTEITQDAIDTVLELIAQNSLYRGQEHKFAVESFNKLRNLGKSFDTELYAWKVIAATDVPASITKIRNTAIGTMLLDLSQGKDLEDAVKAFEAMVAPANYKRPTALITKAMIKKAKEKLNELGLTSALERRYASINDITVNNILFADKQARNIMTGDVFDELVATTGTKANNFDKVEEVSIDRLISEILPRTEKIEVLFENKHSCSLVSLIAPADPTAGNLFKWDNKFSWSYNGEMADSIKERVKKAGGNITGEFCCRLAWDYTDDLDFHMTEPNGGHIFYMTRGCKSPCGGSLDVDANGTSGMMKEPVENIFYERIKTMKEGVYTLYVNNYTRRSSGVGFEVEIDILGTMHNFVYDKVIKVGANVQVAKLKYSHAKGLEIIESLPTTQSTKTLWNLPTQTFHTVNVMMLSPNYWNDRAVGNKHYFFMLDGCKNDGTARGFFNEFLKEDLNAHRKVFEVVGSKMKLDSSVDAQLSGLGFSSTQRNELICRVTGSFTRTIKIVF